MEFKISKELEDYRNSINFMDYHINNMISNKKEDLIASAKAKLMAGEPMTEEEANLTLHI